MTELLFTVAGMTCENCKRHVTEALRDLAGVTAVEVALDTGSVTLRANREIPRSEIAAALDEAGYTFA